MQNYKPTPKERGGDMVALEVGTWTNIHSTFY